MVQGDVVGYICAAIAVVFFGSNFVPVKRYETGDGVFFQWVLCSAIWVAGFVVNCIQGFPPFEPFAVLGGVLWCTGNITVVPIIKMIGLGMGLLLWGLSNLVFGWLSGTILFKETVNRPVFNYIGFAVAIASTFVYIFVDTHVDNVIPDRDDDELESKSLVTNELTPNGAPSGTSWVDKLSKTQKRIFGILLSIIAGLFYGTNFDPPTYLQTKGHSQDGLDYVFSHFCGIYLTSTFYFLVYCIIKKNKPDIYPKVVFPAFISGLMWAVADSCWFVANAQLNLNVAFPLITTGPGLIGALWGVFVFREIRGAKNYLVLVAAFLTTVVAVALIAYSKA